jgi:hypothetical protein
MGQYDNEPTVATALTVEMLTDAGWQSHPASIADLTRQELWVSLDRKLAEPLDPGRSVRLVLSHPKRPTQVAETVVLWHLGRNGNVVVLKRPGLWDPPSRREHMRVDLAVPVYIRADDGSDPVPTTSVNIGVGGLFCVAAMDLRIGQRVDVAIQLMPGRTFECQAEVARLDEDPNDLLGLQLTVGLRFLDLTTEDQVTLARTIAQLARDVDANFVPRPWRLDDDAAGGSSFDADESDGAGEEPGAGDEPGAGEEPIAGEETLIAIDLDDPTT